MANDHYSAFDHKEWEAAGLKDFGDFAECVEYINQCEYGDGQLEGDWYYGDDDTLTVYAGSFGNYNSPGASAYTFANVYDDADEYRARVASLAAEPEYLDSEDDSEDEGVWGGDDDSETDEDEDSEED
jgi:hypothetical protein